MEPHSNFHEVSPIIEGDTAESVAGPSGSGEESQVLEVADEDVWVEEAAYEVSLARIALHFSRLAPLLHSKVIDHKHPKNSQKRPKMRNFYWLAMFKYI